jgi:hypothetical protein
MLRHKLLSATAALAFVLVTTGAVAYAEPTGNHDEQSDYGQPDSQSRGGDSDQQTAYGRSDWQGQSGDVDSHGNHRQAGWQGQDGKDGKNDGRYDSDTNKVEPPSPAATPELDPGALYAIGLAGLSVPMLYRRFRR